METAKALCEIRAPRFFTAGAVLWINVYGLLLGVPFLLIVAFVSFRPLGISTVVIPLLFLAVAIYCLPLGLGNPHARRIANKIKPGNAAKNGYIVQLAMRPRLRGGMRATMEDADDIGWLSMKDSCLIYEGDSVRLQVPLSQVRSVVLRNVGFRGLFIYGARISVSAPDLGTCQGFEVADRSSIFLPQSRRVMRRIHQELHDKVAAARKLEALQ